MGVPHDVTAPSTVEMAKNTKKSEQLSAENLERKASNGADQAIFNAAVEKQNGRAISAEVPIGKATMVTIPNLVGQSVRSVIETCSRLGLNPSLIGEGVALQQFPDAGTGVPQGSQVTIRFGRAAQLMNTAAHGDTN
jgi:hypothetical protein